MPKKIFCLLAMCGFSQFVFAAEWPEKPVNLVVAYAAGGSADNISRLIGNELGKKWGQPVVVENKPGGGGIIAVNQVMKAKPDGYVLGFYSSAYLSTPILMKGKTYDPLKDMVPVVLLARSPNVMLVSKKMGVKNYADFLKKVNSDNITVNYGTSGIGSSIHLGMELFFQMVGLPAIPIHYRGASAARNDLTSGVIDTMQMSAVNARIMTEAGYAFPIAITSKTRSPLMPNVPSMNELGLNDYDMAAWYGIFAPKGTPVNVINKIQNDAAEVLSRKAISGKILEMDGAEVLSYGSKDFMEFIRKDYVVLKSVIEKANINID